MIISPELDGLRRQVEDCIASAYTKGYKRGQAELRSAHTPCDLCAYNPPSSCDGKPCTVCPATGKGTANERSGFPKPSRQSTD